jgi:hypothetical protein
MSSRISTGSLNNSSNQLVIPEKSSTPESQRTFEEINLDEVDMYSSQELEESVTALAELKDIFTGLGWIVKTQTPQLTRAETTTESANTAVEKTVETLEQVRQTMVQNKSLSTAIIITTVAVGALVGGPIGLLVAAKASVALAGAGIGAGAGASLGWGLTELLNR